MTLFIACLLIYHFNMEWWWYGVAAAIWLYQLYVLEDFTSKLKQSGYKSN